MRRECHPPGRPGPGDPRAPGRDTPAGWSVDLVACYCGHPCPFPSSRSISVSALASTVATSSPRAVETEGLRQNGTGGQLRRPIDLLCGRGAAHQDDAAQQPGPAPHNREEESVSRHLRKTKIEQHEIKAGLVQHLIRRVRIGDRDDLVVKGLEGPLQSSAQRGLVIHDEYSARLQEATWVSGVR